MRLQSLARWSVVNAESLPTTSHLMRLSGSLASASHSACGPLFFSAPLLQSLNTSSLLVFTPCSPPPSLNDSWKQKKHYSLVRLVHFLRFSPLLLNQTGIGQSTINLFLNQAVAHRILAGFQGVLPSLGLFSVASFFVFWWGRKDVSSPAAEYAFVGCGRLTHCRSFGNKPGWLYSPGPGCFSHHCSGDASRTHSNPPEFSL